MQVNKIFKVAIIDKVLVSHAGLTSIVNKLLDFTTVDNQVIFNTNKGNHETLDVLLYSTKSIDLNVIHELKDIQGRWRKLPIVVLAPRISRDEQLKLINLNIKALIVQEATPNSLNQSLQCVIHQGIYYPEILMDSLKENTKGSLDGHLVKEAFSDLQKQILQLLASGLTTAVVAERLFKSTRTIEWHKEQMMKTTNLVSTSQLLLFALEYGIIESPFSLPGQVQQASGTTASEQLYLS